MNIIAFCKKFIQKFSSFPYVAQHDTMDCGPACLAMISQFYGRKKSIQELREYCYLSRDGVSLLGIEDGAKKIGFQTVAVKISSDELIQKTPLPCILFWDNSHFVVLYKITSSIFSKRKKFMIMDPSYGKMSLSKTEFEEEYSKKGIALLLSPKNFFYQHKKQISNKISTSFILSFLRPHKREIFILTLALTFSSLFNLAFPFLTQALIDIGISANNLNFIIVILLAQIFLFLGGMMIEIIQNWVLVFINSKINISIISNFLTKIIKLPFRFFDTKQLGDFSARIGDHQRIEEFLTSQSLIVVFSSLNFLVFFFVLIYYDIKIVLTYSTITLIAIFWSIYFLKKLRKIDYHRFRYQSESQQAIYELVNGIVEVKLNNIENYKVDQWKDKQIKLFNVNLNTVKLEHIQSIGYDFLNQLKNIVVIFISAVEVISGNITLGALLSISYIIGQMNSPLNQLIEFLRSWQYAKLSFERLNEVQVMENEDSSDKLLSLKSIGKNATIRISDLSFQYYGPRSPFVLKNLNFIIPFGKTTAIVGESGSGKTTLMKLLLKFYTPVKGDIFYDNYDLNKISAKNLRKHCGVVMQDGYIFSDTLKRNIATGNEKINAAQLEEAIKIANLESFVNNLPQKLETMLGTGGNGISGGQKQRILIARAVYKNPHFIMFDEATSSLDADNERIIYENLNAFFKEKTVIKIAHRLSTVKNADQIIVLSRGEIVEIGNHEKLVSNQANYFNLVKNQLELSV